MNANASSGEEGGSARDERGMDATTATLAPLLAGARARGMADALDLLGLAAVLIDDRGLALHVNGRAQSLFGAHLGLCEGRLKAASDDADRALRASIESALTTPRAAGLAIISRGGDKRALALHVLPVNDDDDRFQILKAVVVIKVEGETACSLERARLAGLN